MRLGERQRLWSSPRLYLYRRPRCKGTDGKEWEADNLRWHSEGSGWQGTLHAIHRDFITSAATESWHVPGSVRPPHRSLRPVTIEDKLPVGNEPEPWPRKAEVCRVAPEIAERRGQDATSSQRASAHGADAILLAGERKEAGSCKPAGDEVGGRILVLIRLNQWFTKFWYRGTPS